MSEINAGGLNKYASTVLYRPIVLEKMNVLHRNIMEELYFAVEFTNGKFRQWQLAMLCKKHVQNNVKNK